MAPADAPTKGPAYDLGRRIAAARAYKEVDQTAVARKIGVKRQALGRYEKGFIPRHSRDGAISGAAKATGLPPLFFTINFNDLPKMVEALAWKRDEGDDDGAVGEPGGWSPDVGPPPGQGDDEAQSESA